MSRSAGLRWPQRVLNKGKKTVPPLDFALRRGHPHLWHRAGLVADARRRDKRLPEATTRAADSIQPSWRRFRTFSTALLAAVLSSCICIAELQCKHPVARPTAYETYFCVDCLAESEV